MNLVIFGSKINWQFYFSENIPTKIYTQKNHSRAGTYLPLMEPVEAVGFFEKLKKLKAKNLMKLPP